MTSQRKKEITRLLKGNVLEGYFFNTKYITRKDRRNKKFSPFEMRSCKGRTKIRKYENRRFRRNKFSLAPHKKEGANYQHSIW